MRININLFLFIIIFSFNVNASTEEERDLFEKTDPLSKSTSLFIPIEEAPVKEKKKPRISKAKTVEDVEKIIFKGEEEKDLTNTLIVVDFDETVGQNTLFINFDYQKDCEEKREYRGEISFIYTNEFQREDERLFTHFLKEQVTEEAFGKDFKSYASVEGIMSHSKELLSSFAASYGYSPVSDAWKDFFLKLKESGAIIIIGSGKPLYGGHLLEEPRWGLQKEKLMADLEICSLEQALKHYYCLSGIKMQSLFKMTKILQANMDRDLTEHPFQEVIHIDNYPYALEDSQSYIKKTKEITHEGFVKNLKYTPIHFTQFHDEVGPSLLLNLKKLKEAVEMSRFKIIPHYIGTPEDSFEDSEDSSDEKPLEELSTQKGDEKDD